MTDQTIVQALEAFAHQPRSPVDGALIVSRIISPDTDVAWCRRQFVELAAEMPAEASAAALAESLGKHGFCGAGDYYKSENSALEYVLRSHEGIPISLAMVVLGVGEELGLEATGINFPGHFMVSVDGSLIDPFTMTLVDEIACRRWLKQNRLDPQFAFAPASPVDTVMRMLNNLSTFARASEDNARALELTDYKLAVSSEPLAIYLDRFELWLALGAAEMARRDLACAIDLTPEGDARNILLERMAAIADTRANLH